LRNQSALLHDNFPSYAQVRTCLESES